MSLYILTDYKLTPSSQKELSCEHHYHLVESWCPKYIETQKRCTPNVVSKQYWGDDICGTSSSVKRVNSGLLSTGTCATQNQPLVPWHPKAQHGRGTCEENGSEEL
jgi:hypothetical protein